MNLDKDNISLTKFVLKKAMFGGLIITFLFIIWFLFVIFTSSSSTASIGLIFLPFYSIFIFVISSLFVGSVFFLFTVIKKTNEEKTDIRHILLTIVSSFIILSVIFSLGYYINRSVYIKKSRNLDNTSEIRKMYSIALGKDDAGVLEQLSKNPSTPKDIMYDLYKFGIENDPKLPGGPYYSILIGLAYNYNTPSDILNNLSKSKYSSIRAYVASHHNTPPETLRILSNDNDTLILSRVAGNPNTPIDVVKAMTKFYDEVVRSYAINNLKKRGIRIE